MDSQSSPLCRQQNILESQKIMKQIENLCEQIEQIQNDSRLKNKELQKITSSDTELRKNKKKAQSKRLYLVDNKADDPAFQEQIRTLKTTIQEISIEIASLNRKKEELKIEIDTLDNQEEIKTQQKFKLEDKLTKVKQKEHLAQQVCSINNRVHKKVQEFKESSAKFYELYQNASNQKLKEFYFAQLKKIAGEAQKLYEERQKINETIKKSAYHEEIGIEESKMDFLVENFPSAQKFFEFCKFQKEKEPDLQDKQKKILLNLLQSDPNYKLMYEKLEEIRISKEFQQRTRAKRQFEEKQRREEQQQIERQRQEEEKKRTEEEARQRKLQFEQKQNKFNQYLPKLATVKNQINLCSLRIAQIQIKEQQGSQKMQQCFQNLQQLISTAQNKLNDLDLLLKEFQPLANELNKRNQLNQTSNFKDSTANQITEHVNKLPEFQERISKKVKIQQEEQQRLERERQAAIERELAKLPPINLKFYEQDIDRIAKEKQLGPQTLRFLHNQQKYLNQLRVMIELRGVSKQQLSAYQFDVEKYNSLVTRKTELIEGCHFPLQISEDLLKQQPYQSLMSKLDAVESQLAPLETIFDQKYIKGLLYKYPEELLRLTKQELFQKIEQSKIQQYQHELKKAKEETEHMNSLLKQAEAERKQLEQKSKELELIKEARLKEYGQEINKQYFIAPPEEGKVLDKDEYSPMYKVAITNEVVLRKQYEDLINDSKLREVREKLEEVNKQRQRQKSAYQQSLKAFANQRNNTRTSIVRKIYLGDYQKVKNDPNVQNLEAELKQLKEKWLQMMEAKKRRQSRYSQGSQFHIVSRIEEY